MPDEAAPRSCQDAAEEEEEEEERSLILDLMHILLGSDDGALDLLKRHSGIVWDLGR